MALMDSYILLELSSFMQSLLNEFSVECQHNINAECLELLTRSENLLTMLIIVNIILISICRHKKKFFSQTKIV